MGRRYAFGFAQYPRRRFGKQTLNKMAVI